jgi:hypothetical protein
MASSVFPTATQARYNPIRETILHQEARSIEHQILIASSNGFYNVTINNNTPMTNSVVVTNELWSIDVINNNLLIPNHGLSTGAIVTVYSSGVLPAPLAINTFYYVIYIDPNTIKLANSFINARAGIPIAIQFTSGVNTLSLTNSGSGYLTSPNVSIVGGNANISASASATLASYGDVVSITPINPGSYTNVPTLTATPQGSNAATESVTFTVVAATISYAGTNYRVGDILTVQGGSGTSATVVVTNTDGLGAVLAIAVSNSGSYGILPNLNSVTTVATPSGGNGCTLNLNMGIGSITISNGGFGYLAAPSIIISGGNGTGASAIALLNAGAVSAIQMINAGQGYTTNPEITITSGNSLNAAAVLTPTSVFNVMITSNSDTYTSVPNVTISAQGSGATISAVYMQCITASLWNTGSGYQPGDLLQISGGAGTSSATISVLSTTSTGQIVTYTLTNGGSYSALPALTNLVNNGTGTGATFNLSFGLSSITLASGGNNYVTSPTVLISGTGYGATAIAPVINGTVTNVIVQSAGIAFNSIPSVYITAGSGAIAVANLTPTSLGNINVGNVGSGYTYATVVIDGVATANAIVSNGSVIGYTITNNGGNTYVTTPNVHVSGDGVGATATSLLTPTTLAGITLLSGGSDFTAAPNVTISGSATAIAPLTATGIARVDILSGGYYYNSPPTITASAGQQNDATFSSQIGYAINSLVINNPGDDYESVPNVVISSPSVSFGIQATGVANIGAGSGTFALQQYNASRDYWAVWKNLTPSNPDLARPYADQISTIISYFTNLGYTINQQTNPITENTFQWVVKW